MGEYFPKGKGMKYQAMASPSPKNHNHSFALKIKTPGGYNISQKRLNEDEQLSTAPKKMARMEVSMSESKESKMIRVNKCKRSREYTMTPPQKMQLDI